MMHENISTDAPVSRSRARRWLLVACGVACVVAAALGIVVPGLPTTVFLIVASWCFTRSCPWLEDRLLRNRLFRPYLSYLEPGAAMPRRARITSTVLMWAAILISAAVLEHVWIGALLLAAGALGTWFVWRLGRGGAPGETARSGAGSIGR